MKNTKSSQFTKKERELIEYATQGYTMGWFVNNLLYFEKPVL
jgi:hypothetical protein